MPPARIPLCHSSFVLIDWAKPQASADKLLRSRGVTVCRYKIDLRHLWLPGVAELCLPVTRHSLPTPTPQPTGTWRRMAIAKHLCGCATDFSLRSLVASAALDTIADRTTEAAAGRAAGAGAEVMGAGLALGVPDGIKGVAGSEGDGRSPRSAPPFKGMMIATCCHHRCTWGSYVNRPFLESVGICEADFPIVCLLSSWATGASTTGASTTAASTTGASTMAAATTGAASEGRAEGSTKGGGETLGGLSQDASTPTLSSSAVDVSGSTRTAEEEHSTADPEALRAITQCLGERVDRASRIELGRMCKQLLDTGRLRYLEAHGYATHLQMYVPPDVSPENVLLVAQRKGTHAAKGVIE